MCAPFLCWLTQRAPSLSGAIITVVCVAYVVQVFETNPGARGNGSRSIPDMPCLVLSHSPSPPLRRDLLEVPKNADGGVKNKALGPAHANAPPTPLRHVAKITGPRMADHPPGQHQPGHRRSPSADTKAPPHHHSGQYRGASRRRPSGASRLRNSRRAFPIDPHRRRIKTARGRRRSRQNRHCAQSINHSPPLVSRRGLPSRPHIPTTQDRGQRTTRHRSRLPPLHILKLSGDRISDLLERRQRHPPRRVGLRSSITTTAKTIGTLS